MGKIRCIYSVEGDVQKKRFRVHLSVYAQKIGLVGYAKNIRNGSVEVLVEGDEDVVDNFYNFMFAPLVRGRVEKINKKLRETIPEVYRRTFAILTESRHEQHIRTSRNNYHKFF